MPREDNQSVTETHVLYTYADKREVGTSELTAKQYRHYVAMSDQHTGAIRLGALPHDYYDLAPEFQDLPENTTVYIEE
jgi:hypothetical protein